MRENYRNLTGNLKSNSRAFVESRRKPQKNGHPNWGQIKPKIRKTYLLNRKLYEEDQFIVKGFNPIFQDK